MEASSGLRLLVSGGFDLDLLPSASTEMEFDLDKALEEVPVHLEDPPLPPAPPPELQGRSPDPELPPVELSTLEHRTKGRPRPLRRTKPSREAVGGPQVSGQTLVCPVPTPVLCSSCSSSSGSPAAGRLPRRRSRTASWPSWTRAWTTSSTRKSSS